MGVVAAATTLGAIAISCGKNEDAEIPGTPNNAVSPSAANLSKVAFSGDAHDFEYVVPREVTYVDAKNQFSSSGTKEAVEVLARYNPSETGYVLNRTFMPLRLLRAYLRGNVSEVAGQFLMTDEQAPQGVSLKSLYDFEYGFNTTNYKPVWPGEINKTDFELTYRAKQGVEVDEKALTTVKAPNTVALATYVNLDNTASSIYQALLRVIQVSLQFDDAASTSDNMAWLTKLPLQLPSDVQSRIAKIEFGTADSAKEVTNWSSTFLPSRLNVIGSKALLWVKLTPQPGFALSSNYFSLENNNLLQNVKVALDTDSNYALPDWNKVLIWAKDGRAQLDLSSLSIPSGTKLEFSKGFGEGWKSFNDFSKDLASSTSANRGNFLSRITVSDANKYKLNNEYLSRPNVVSINPVFSDISPLIDQLKNVSVVNTDVNNILWNKPANLNTTFGNWTANGVKPIEGVEFAVSDHYTHSSDAENAGDLSWNSDLPTRISGLNSRTKLWARLKVKPGFLVGPATYLDLTASSSLNKLLSAVNETRLNDVVNEARMLSATASRQSTNSKVVWSPSNISVSNSNASFLSGILFLSGNYKDKAAAVSAPSDAWSTSLPSELDPLPEQRFLWARFIPADGISFQEEYTNLTQTSDVQNVLTVFKADDKFFANNNLNRVVFQAIRGTLVIDESAIDLPRYLEIRYFLNGQRTGSALNATDFIASLQDKTELYFNQINAIFVSTDPRFSVLSPVYKPDVSKLRGFINTMSLMAAAEQNIRMSTSSLASDLKWSNSSTLSSGLVDNDKGFVEYLIGPYQTVQEALKSNDWSQTLPTRLPVSQETVHLYVRVRAFDGYLVNRAIKELTSSADIANVFNVKNVEKVLAAERGEVVDGKTTKGVKALETSADSASVNWENLSEVNSEEGSRFVDDFLYLLGNYPTRALADQADKALWKKRWELNTVAMPNEVGQRFLWVKLVPKPNMRLSSEYADLTDSSGIGKIKAVYDKMPGFDQIDLTKVKLKGTQLDAIVDTSQANLLSGLDVQLRFINNAEWLSRADFINRLKLAPRDLLSYRVLARIVSLDESKVLRDTKDSAIDQSALNYVVDITNEANGFNKIYFIMNGYADGAIYSFFGLPDELREDNLRSRGLVLQIATGTAVSGEYSEFSNVVYARNNQIALPSESLIMYPFSNGSGGGRVFFRIIANRDFSGNLTTVSDQNNWKAILDQVKVDTNFKDWKKEPQVYSLESKAIAAG